MNILMIPDTQVKPGVRLDYLDRIGRYAAHKQPDVIVHIGDHADMPSLSSYDKGKAAFEGRRYWKDIDASRRGMDALLEPIRKARGYSPRLVMTLGNHEQRIARAANDSPEFEGLIGLDDLEYAEAGWEVHDFLEVVDIRGVLFSHYFTSGVMGRPVSSARSMLTKKMRSCVMGHVQVFDVAMQYDGAGRRITGLIAGAAYDHHEDYLGKQGNKHYRGIHMLHDVSKGEFDLMSVSNKFLKKRFK